jgi:hypothetical protein
MLEELEQRKRKLLEERDSLDINTGLIFLIFSRAK